MTAYTVAALLLACLAMPAGAQGLPPLAGPPTLDPGQNWTGTRVGNAEHWRDGQGVTWTVTPLGDKQQIVTDPAGHSRVCVRIGAEVRC
jgi:hypothetical protein